MSTLDYAHRAKNIKNKPEVNQKMTKRVLLREYSSTIERLKAELQATREKNGVYLPIEQYQKMEMNLQGQSSQLTELEVRLVACRGWWRVHGRVCCVCASSNTGMRRWRATDGAGDPAERVEGNPGHVQHHQGGARGGSS